MISATNMERYMIIDGLEISPHLSEISELNNFKSGSLIISGVFGEFCGTAKTKLKINCEVHGAGWEWGNPWKPTISVLKRKGACPKCAGNYRYTEKERVKQLEQLEGIEFKSFEGEYKGNTTRVNMYCHNHKYSWVSSLANLLKGRGCSKCSGVYKHSEHERVAQINSLPNLQFISFPDGYKSGKSKALVRCLKDGYEWEVTVTGLIDKARGCHKCSGSVRVKEDDVICAIEKNCNVTFVAFPDGYVNSHSRVELNCSHCNLNWDISSNKVILKSIKCPTCSDVKRIKTKEQALFLLKRLKGMKFLKFTEGFENLDSIVKMLCLKNKEHIFDVKVKHALTLSGCKICSGKYVCSEDEQIRRLKSKDNFVFIELVDNYKDSHTKALVRCVKDGYEWTSTINQLVNSKSGCPKCAGNLQLSEKELTKAINELPNSQFISFPDGYRSQKDRVEVLCKKHDYIWVSNIHTAIKGMTGCGECRAEKVRLKRRTPKNDVINKINSLENIQFIDFDGDYINGYSNVKVKCLVDGNEWTPTIDNLANGRGCPKCSKVYKYSEAERIEQINKIKNLELVELVDGRAHAKSRVRLRCLHDGFEWETTIDAITLSESGCPRCAHNSWDLKQTLKYAYTWDFDRWLYYIQFKSDSGQTFWKIGLSKGGVIGNRYAPNVLRKDKLVVLDYKTIKTNNLSATLTEYYILSRYADSSIDMRKHMQYSKGGTECFYVDILKDSNLEDEIIKATSIKGVLTTEVETIKQKISRELDEVNELK